MKYAIINTIKPVPQKRKMKIVLIIFAIFILYLYLEVKCIKKGIRENQRMRYERELRKLNFEIRSIKSLLKRQKDSFNQERLKEKKQRAETLKKQIKELS